MKKEYETPEIIIYTIEGCVITSSYPGSGSDEDDDWGSWTSD